MSESRQLAAIVFSDISGFTNTMEGDETRAMSQIQKHREIVTNLISKFNGEILKEMGDGIFLKFNSAVEAVRCANQIQTKTANEDFNLRIGIHLGDVIIQDNDIFGSGVNIASRIHEHGSAGSICISNEIWLQIKNQTDINAQSLGNKKLKGVEGEIEIYQLDVGAKTSIKTNETKEKNPPQTKASAKTNINIYTITGAVLACVGIGFWFFFSTSSLSTADENLFENSIAVFSFEDLSTGDNQSYGEILQHLIISDLTGLKHLEVISQQRLQDIQKQSREGLENYTIAQQANAKVLLAGTIMDRDNGQKILLGNLIDAINGNQIKSHRIEGIDIFSMVDELTENIRKDLEISTHKDDQLALQAGVKTTQSMDAYKKYLEGVKYFNELDWDIAVEKFNEAIFIDSTFMDAYFYLTISLGWRDGGWDTDQSANEICEIILDKKLYHNEIEKQRVEGTCLYTKRNYKASIPLFEKLIEIEPDNKLNWYGIGENYYHAGEKNPKVREEYYPKALSSMYRVLELDPDFHSALYHIFDVLKYNKDFEEIINLDSKYKVNISGKFQIMVLRAYENLGYIEKAEQYYEKIEQTLINNDSLGLCYINAENGYLLSTEDSLFARAKYYAEKGFRFCPPGDRLSSLSHGVFIASTYELEGAETGKKAYYQLINNMDIKEKFDLTWYLGNAFSKSINETKFNLTYDDALFYLNLAIDLSKQLEAPKYFTPKYFTKAIYYYIRALNKAKGIGFASQKMEEQINEHCGGALNIDCFFPFKISDRLADLFYKEGAYDWASRLYKFQVNSIKLFLAEEENVDQDDKELAIKRLSGSHYRLGMMKLKQGNFENTRQDFYDAMATAPKDLPFAPKDLPFDEGWIGPHTIKQRIGECYFKSQNYSNAIKIYRNLFNEKLKQDHDQFNNLASKYSNLSMIALSEFLSGQIDSAKVHFAQVEKKYNDIYDDTKKDKNYYYVQWPLYQFHSANGNTNKAQRFLTDAYNLIPEDERKQYLEDNDRLEHQHQYYYIHEIIDTYNQNIR